MLVLSFGGGHKEDRLIRRAKGIEIEAGTNMNEELSPTNEVTSCTVPLPLAKNILTQKPIETWKEFEYKDLGSMATIGKNKAVVDLPRFKFKGWFAWVVWMFLHLMLILTVRNKLIILINWAWNYLSKDSTLRIILSNPKKKKPISETKQVV
jgi:hypothetical protein